MNKLFLGVTISMEWKSYTTIRNTSYILSLDIMRSRYIGKEETGKYMEISPIKLQFKIRLFLVKHFPIAL